MTRNSERSGVQQVSWEELARLRDQGDDQTKNYKVPPELIELARSNRKGRGSVGTLTPVAPRPAEAEAVDVVVPVNAPAPLVERPSPAEGLSAPPVPYEELTPSALARVAIESAIVERDPASDELGAAPSVSIESERVPLEELPEEDPGIAVRQAPVVAPASAAPESELDQAPSRFRQYAPVLTGSAIVAVYVAFCYLATALFSSLP